MVRRFLLVPVLLLGLLAGCGSSDSSETTTRTLQLTPKPAPKPVKLTHAQLEKLALGVTQSLRSSAAELGENDDYRVRCRQVGETDQARCQVTPFVEESELITYTRRITFDPSNPARCIGDSGLIECPAGAP